MLKIFYSISEKIQEKDIYIYGINRDSMAVFTKLAFLGGDIEGFIDITRRFVGEYFMNRPIISIEQINNLPNAIVIAPDVIEKSVVKETIGIDAEVFYYGEILVPNNELKEKDVYIYGIGGYGEKVYEQCRECGIKIKAVCVTKIGNITVWNDLPVLGIDEVNEQDDCAFVIATIRSAYRKQMLETLSNYRGDKYVFNYMLPHHISEGRMFQVIGRAVSEHKKIWLYGKNEELAEKIIEILTRYFVEIQGKISDLYDLAYGSIEDIVVIITENDEYEVEQACDILDSLGFALEHWNYTSLACETIKYKLRVKSASDLLLRWSYVSNDTKYPGFIVYGNNNRQNIKIMVVGSSTSTDGIYRTKSWVNLFYQKLRSENYQVTVYNGAVCGHGVARELLHLLRDGAYMELDYVITLSGVINVVDHGIKNYFSGDLGDENNDFICGLESKESLYEFWVRNIKIMKSVAELYGARFYSFLQPMAVKEEMSLFEAVMHETLKCRKGMLEFRELASQEEKRIYVNAIDYLDKESDMYIDNCHYSNKANKLIADFVYKAMIKEEGTLKKKKR